LFESSSLAVDDGYAAHLQRSVCVSVCCSPQILIHWWEIWRRNCVSWEK